MHEGGKPMNVEAKQKNILQNIDVSVTIQRNISKREVQPLSPIITEKKPQPHIQGESWYRLLL